MKKNFLRSWLVFLGLVAFAEVQGAEYALSVSLSDSIRTVTHCASGSLYGMTETLPADIDAHVKALNPNVFVQPAMSGAGRQQPIGDAFKVADRLKTTTGKVQIRLADVLPGWPYKWLNKEDWLASVKTVIQKKLSSGLTNFDGYEIWNEPYGTWKNENGDFHSVLWKPTYDLIRSMDPGAKIIGPSLSFYNSTRMSDFLKYCKTNNCLPEVISWHQWGSEGFIGSLENYRALEKTLGISKRAISINEYSSGTHEYEGSPGVSVPFIAKFERNGVESAMISWWFTNLPGRLGSLLTAKNEKGGGWWLYKWYGDMSGYMAKVVPPNDKSDGVDAFAAVDKNLRYASIVLGGNSVGTVNVKIDKIPAFFGSEVEVSVEQVTWVNKDTPVADPQKISTTKYSIVNSAISVPVNVTNSFYAYRLYITPTKMLPQEPFKNTHIIPGTIQAEDYDLGGQNNAYYDNDAENQGGVYREDGVDIVGSAALGYSLGYTEVGEWLEYTVNVKTEGLYTLESRVSSGADAPSFRLFLDDKAITDTIKVTKGADWDTYNIVSTPTSKLSAGPHILKLAITGSFVNIDWLKFTEGTTRLNQKQNEFQLGGEREYLLYSLNGAFQGAFKASDVSSLKNKVKNSKLQAGVFLVRSKNSSSSQLIEF